MAKEATLTPVFQSRAPCTGPGSTKRRGRKSGSPGATAGQPRGLLAPTRTSRGRVILIPWASDLRNTGKNRQVTMTTTSESLNPKTNLPTQPLYSVLLTDTWPSLQLRFLCYFKATATHCESRHATPCRGRRAGTWQPPASLPAAAHSGSSRNFSSCPSDQSEAGTAQPRCSARLLDAERPSRTALGCLTGSLPPLGPTETLCSSTNPVRPVRRGGQRRLLWEKPRGLPGVPVWVADPQGVTGLPGELTLGISGEEVGSCRQDRPRHKAWLP